MVAEMYARMGFQCFCYSSGKSILMGMDILHKLYFLACKVLWQIVSNIAE